MHPNDLQISNSVGKSNTPCFYHPQAEISKLHKENHKQKRMNSKATETCHRWRWRRPAPKSGPPYVSPYKS